MAALARRIALHAAISMGGRGVGIAINAVTFLYIARTLGPERFGLYALAVVFVTMFATVIDNGVNITVTRLLTERPESAALVLTNGLVLKLTGAAILTLIAIGAAHTPWVDPRLREVAPIAAGLILVMGLTVANAYFQARVDMGWVVAGDLVTRGLFFALAAMVLSRGGGVRALLAAQVAAAALGALVPTSRVLWVLRDGFRMDAAMWRVIAGPALALSGSLALGMITARFDAIALSTRVPERDLGLYSAAFRILDLLLLVPGLLLQVVFPAFVHDTRATIASRYARVTGMLLVLGLPLAAVLTVTSGPALALTAGDAYRDGGRSLAVLSWGMLAVFVASAMLYVLVALGRFSELLVYSALGSITSVTLALLLVPRYGTDGAATATVTAHTMVLLGLGWALRSEGISPVPSLVPEALGIAVAGALTAAVLLPSSGLPVALAATAVVGAGLAGALPRVRRELQLVVRPRVAAAPSAAR